MIKAFVSLVSLICLGLTTVGLSGCSPLALFDALGPRDKGGRLVLKDAAYGEDPRQRLDVFVPSVAPERAPVLVFFYGGSWNSGSKADYAFAAQALAAQGFVTVLPDYRLYPKVRFPISSKTAQRPSPGYGTTSRLTVATPTASCWPAIRRAPTTPPCSG